MGRLSGFTYREVTRRLRVVGFRLDRQAAGSHEIWVRDADQRVVTVPRHARDMREGTLRAILRQAGLTPEEFLAL